MLAGYEGGPLGIKVGDARIGLAAEEDALVGIPFDPCGCRDVAQGKSHAPPVRGVGIRSVDDPGIVNRDVSGTELQVHTLESSIRSGRIPRCSTYLSGSSSTKELRSVRELFCVPGRTRMQPFSTVDSVPATQRVVTSMGSRGQ